MKKILMIMVVLLVIGGVAGGLTVLAQTGNGEADDHSGTKWIAVGNIFEVPLNANFTTGYRWVVEYDNTLLELIDERYEVESDLIGGPGRQVFVFRALSVGSAQLEFSYKRPWEDESIKTITSTFEIMPSLDDDNRFPQGEPEMVEVSAPIHQVDIEIAESWPPQYFLHVVSGLPNGCARFDSYSVAPRTGDSDTIRVEVINLEPADGLAACAEVYGFVEHTIRLGSDFVPGKTYMVVVNDVTETFVAQ